MNPMPATAAAAAGHRGARARPQRRAARCSSRRAVPTLRALERPDRRALAQLGLTTARDRLAGRARRSAHRRRPALARCARAPRCCRRPPPTIRRCCASRRTRRRCCTCAATCASLSEPQLAMVGSRNPTAGGRATAREFAALLRARRPHHHQRAGARHRCRLPRRRARRRRAHHRRARLRARPDLSAREHRRWPSASPPRAL